MYLEISGRQSGKTSRLLEYAKMVDSYKIALVAPSHAMAKILRKRADDSSLHCEVFFWYDKIYEDELKPGPHEYERVLYDDFDCYKDYPSLVIRDTDYYFTTPYRFRSASSMIFDNEDPLLKLYRANEGYVNHINLQKVRDSYAFLDEDRMQLEWLGRFIR